MTTDHTALTELLDKATRDLDPVLTQMAWAEEEISLAIERHPHAADTLHHSFTLIRPTNDRRMNAEFIYRGHCRELLDRIANGEDTRPGTAAEVAIALCEVGLATPLNDAATGLIFRMWSTFPDLDQDTIDTDLHHRESLHGDRIGEVEATVRAKTAVADREFGNPECHGWHHGDPVQCWYGPQTPPEAEQDQSIATAQAAA